MTPMTRHELARMIDHTALKPDTTEGDVVRLCAEAHRHGFASVCVMPYFVPLAARTLAGLGSHVAVCTTIGFPIGAHQTEVKVAEARQAVHEGARELDMVINIGALKSGNLDRVEQDIYDVAEVARAWNGITKAIIETALLNDEEKRRACEIASAAGADFVKTSTGFNGGGATAEDIRLMREAVAPGVRVKASGGIRDYATAIAMIEAGATRIGASAGVSIIEGVPA